MTGKDYNHDKKYDEAIAYYDTILKKEPDNLNALNNKACNLAYLGKPDEAIKIFDTIIARNSDSFAKYMAVTNKATVVDNSGNEYTDASSIQFDGISQTSPGWGSNVSIINTLTSLGDYESALIACRRLPRLPAMTYMVYGSLSADFRQLLTFSKESETIEETIVKMKKYQKEKTPKEKKNLHGVLIFAPDD